MKKTLLLLALCAPFAAFATTMLRADLPALTRASDVIVRAKVLKQESRYTKDKKRIVTDIELEVTEALKGEPAKVVKIVQPGGQVGEFGQKVHGLPTFKPTEEVVLFLERSGPVFQVTGMAQGKYRIEKNGDQTMVVPELVDANLVDPSTGKPVEDTAARRAMTFEAFRLEVKKLQLPAQPAEPTSPGPVLTPAPGTTTP